MANLYHIKYLGYRYQQLYNHTHLIKSVTKTVTKPTHRGAKTPHAKNSTQHAHTRTHVRSHTTRSDTTHMGKNHSLGRVRARRRAIRDARVCASVCMRTLHSQRQSRNYFGPFRQSHLGTQSDNTTHTRTQRRQCAGL